ncbi:MAG TPA: undecaprenyl-diphosphate phosphatase [Thermoanaerobaculia bacterium]|nr:undecaprenyl-diphosphate phosphatase [Thermoanaerobaculia bacterium]
MSVSVGQAVLLGAVQGLTEFLPVSSTAHLALAQRFLPGFAQPGILFDVLLHVGTLAAVVVFFRERLGRTFAGLASSDPASRRAAWKLAGLLILAVALTGAVTLPLKSLAVENMGAFRMMGGALLAMAVLLLVAQRFGTRLGEGGRTLDEMRPRDAALVGALQSLSAIFHGFSRSGNTIATGLFCGLSRRAAAEFSFLLSIPTILAAAAVENLHAYRHHTGPLSDGSSLPAYGAGMLVSAVVGYFAVGFLMKVIVAMRLTPFIAYCALLGATLLVFGGRLESGSVGGATLATLAGGVR